MHSLYVEIHKKEEARRMDQQIQPISLHQNLASLSHTPGRTHVHTHMHTTFSEKSFKTPDV